MGRIILLFAINFAAVFLLNWQLALISVIVVPVIVLTSILFFRKVNKAYEAYQAQEAILSTTLQENLSGVRVVKAFARQDFETREVREGELGEVYARAQAAAEAARTVLAAV